MYTKNFEIKWIVKFFRVSLCMHSNHFLKAKSKWVCLKFCTVASSSSMSANFYFEIFFLWVIFEQSLHHSLILFWKSSVTFTAIEYSNTQAIFLAFCVQNLRNKLNYQETKFALTCTCSFQNVIIIIIMIWTPALKCLEKFGGPFYLKVLGIVW